MSAVLEIILKLAKQKAGGEKVNTCHVLYGYVQLVNMNENMLEHLLPSEQNKQEINEIKAVFNINDIDTGMMKKGLSLLLAGSIPGEIAKEFREDTIQNSSADRYLKGLLESSTAIVSVFKNGCTLNDAIELKKRIGESPAFEQTEASQEKPEEKPDNNHDNKPEEGQDNKPEEKTQKENQSGTGAGVKEEGIEHLVLSSKNLFYQLKESIIGQDDAIEVFVRGYFKSEMFAGLSDTFGKPRAVFLFAGPPGVGKTLLATEAARILKRPSLRLNMSEYSDPQAANELIGISKKYAQASRGKLTSFVASNPVSVILFDEIERASLNVIHLFLQILDEGVLQDSFEEKNVSFKDAILIFTTNAGKALYEENREKNLSHLDPVTVIDALEKEEHPIRYGSLFPAAICSRFTSGNVVVFNHLGAKHLQRIVRMNYDRCAKQISEKLGWQVRYDEKLPAVFLYQQSVNLDARIISSQSYQFIQNELYEYTRQAVEHVSLDEIKEVCFRVNLDHCSQDVRKLFEPVAAPKAAIFGEAAWTEPMDGAAVLYQAEDMASLNKILSNEDISFILIDPDYGTQDVQNGFSLDDMETLGMRAFHTIRRSLPEVPVYLLNCDDRLRDVDRITFTKQGASGFINHSKADASVIADEFRSIAAQNDLQKQLSELAGKGRRLAFNTAQKVENGGHTAVIEFYDFKVYTAVDAMSQSLVLSDAEKPKVSFSDIIGAESAKSELRYFVEYLKHPRKFIVDGVKPPKGILLYGPPGTGKTMLARAMAGEAEATFLPANATDFMNKYIGEGENRIRTLFSVARRYAPSVIFIDEIDAIAKERTGESHVETYLNALMTEMDGFHFDVNRPVFVLAATNFPIDKAKAEGRGVIDPALLRRFDNKIEVDLPNQKEREAYLHRLLDHSRQGAVKDDIIRNIAERTTGESLANLQNIVNLAIRNAGKERKTLTDDVLIDAMEEYYYGGKREWDEEYYNKVAHHEAGHAYMACLSGRKPSFITIVSRSDFGGYMQQAGSEETPSYTKDELLWRIRTALAGRASEIVFFGKEAGINTGVSGDLQQATNLALKMICSYGMEEDALLSLDVKTILSVPYGDQILDKAEEILRKEMEETIRLVEDGKNQIEKLSQELLKENQLVGDQIRKILGDGKS